MEIAFSSKSLRSLCLDETKAIEELGEIAAAQLKRRLADIRAAESVYDIPVGKPRLFDKTCNINLHNDLELKFCANHNNNPLTKTGKINWKRVSRIKVIMIGKFNAK